ncbi:hypothetical protein CGZ90_04540 [Fictibacillus aquaticus]|uniref:Uncharacterized protein n=1 Tax=Fictibacillus aquaticus TaxID=2021314 RepID=A0A235FCR1_9BACL|nr:hypothetical protein CGZ90_04540 [Fictibacillus aquaticus]
MSPFQQCSHKFSPQYVSLFLIHYFNMNEYEFFKKFFNFLKLFITSARLILCTLTPEGKPLPSAEAFLLPYNRNFFYEKTQLYNVYQKNHTFNAVQRQADIV